MTNSQLISIRSSFKELETLLSASTSGDELFRGNDRFERAFSSAQKSLGKLENEWILESQEFFNSRDAIRSVIEELEIIQSYVKKDLKPENGESLTDRIQKAKNLLKEANQHIAPKQ